MKRILAAIIVTAGGALAGCGGGSGSQTTLPGTPRGGKPPVQTAQAAITIKIPPTPRSHGIGPNYVSPGTQSMSIAVTDPSSNTVTYNFDLLPTSTGCTQDTNTQTITCSSNVPVPVSGSSNSDTFTVIAYDQIGGTGCSGCHQLSSATVSQHILSGVANQINMTLNGIVASIGVVLSTHSVYNNRGSVVIPFTVNPIDGAGFLIVGPGLFTQSISLVLDPGSSAHVGSNKTSLAGPADDTGLQLTYDGNVAVTSSTLTASASGATSGMDSFAVSNPPPPVPNPNSLAFLAAGLSFNQTFVVSESGFGGPWGESDNCSGLASVSTSDNITFTVTPIVAGACTITVSDPFGQTNAVAVSVTTSGFGIH